MWLVVGWILIVCKYRTYCKFCDICGVICERAGHWTFWQDDNNWGCWATGGMMKMFIFMTIMHIFHILYLRYCPYECILLNTRNCIKVTTYRSISTQLWSTVSMNNNTPSQWSIYLENISQVNTKTFVWHKKIDMKTHGTF